MLHRPLEAAIAFDRLFNLEIDKPKLVEYAAEGEIASAGVKHYDNVSASVLGGFVIVRTNPKLEVIRIEPPEDSSTCNSDSIDKSSRR